jgi:SpoVK/Ycf46/Vps4 family AAA+-type ATPase
MKVTNTQTAGHDALKILIFGEPGAGKTTLAGTIYEPTLIISAEAGLLSLSGKKIDVIDISLDDNGAVIPKEKRIARLGEAYKYLLESETQKKYKWVFIDSLTEISQNLVEQLQQEFPDRKDSLVLYGENAKRMRSLIKTFRDLPMYNVVFTALSSIEKDENAQRFTTVNVVGRISEALPAYFDEVFYLAATQTPEGEIKRILVTNKTDKIVCKDRSGKLDKFESPDLGAIAAKIKGIKTKENKNA